MLTARAGVGALEITIKNAALIEGGIFVFSCPFLGR